MAKFILMKDAADQLGVTPEELNEMRERGEIHGYRDGTTWKFKDEEVARVKEERASGGGDADLSPFGFDEGLKLADDAGEDMSHESILVSEEELGHSGESTSSTIIGKLGGKAEPKDSDLQLQTAESSLAFLPESASSDMKLVAGEHDSDLKLSSDLVHDSDVRLVPGSAADSDVSLIPSGTDLKLAPEGKPSKSDLHSGTDLQLTSPSSGGTGALGGRVSDLAVGSSDLDLHLDSGLALAEDDDLVLGGSGIGSDVTMAGDSGINLSSPTDSGLSLEDEPLDLAGASAISSLELPEDDGLALDEALDQTADFKPEEEFLLEPSGESMPDETDSGSQVIALEDSSGSFDPNAGFASLEVGGEELQPAEGVAVDAAGFGAGVAPMPTPAAAGMVYEAPEAPYTILQIISLLSVLLVLSLSGMLMMDVLRNMWSWDKSSSAATSIADGIAGFLK